MSKLFFDHLLELEKIEKEIKKAAKTPEEREELWLLVDEIVHHKVLECILDKLPRTHHEEFLEIFHKFPHNEEIVFGYLKTKIGDNVESLVKQEIGITTADLLENIKK